MANVCDKSCIAGKKQIKLDIKDVDKAISFHDAFVGNTTSKSKNLKERFMVKNSKQRAKL